MMAQTNIWLLAILVGISLVVLFRWINKRQAFKNREPQSLELTFKNEIAGEVQFVTYEKLFNAVGEAFKVDPKLLRPADSLDKFLSLDSWDLGEGTEILDSLIEESFHITSLRSEPSNLLELMKAIESQQSLKRETEKSQQGKLD